eukprot:56109-Chlamydomonas_euryale.AAC.1
MAASAQHGCICSSHALRLAQPLSSSSPAPLCICLAARSPHRSPTPSGCRPTATGLPPGRRRVCAPPGRHALRPQRAARAVAAARTVHAAARAVGRHPAHDALQPQPQRRRDQRRRADQAWRRRQRVRGNG